MSSKAEQRKAKKRQKQRKKREIASVRRSKQISRLTTSDLATTTNWPLGDCYVSENWYEPNATVQMIFTRRSSDGALAGASFEVDLAEGVVRAAQPLIGLTEGSLQTALVHRSDETAMMTQDASLIVKLVDTVENLSKRDGRTLPKELEAAKRIFGDVSAADCAHDIPTGEPPPTEPPRKPGLMTRFLDKMFAS